MKITFICLISFAAAVAALPTTSVNKAATGIRSDNGADDYPVKWSKLKRGDDGADDYPVKWSKREDEGADDYPVKWS
jgi:hypothetical protein